MRDQASTLHVEADYALATWKQVFVIFWRGETTLAAVANVRRRVGEFGALHPEGTGLFSLVYEDSPLLNAKVGEGIAQFLREATHVRASALVFEGTGFRATTVRSVVKGMTMLARQRFSHRVFASLDEAGRWLMPSLAATGVPIGEPDELVAAIAQLRARVDRELSVASPAAG